MTLNQATNSESHDAQVIKELLDRTLLLESALRSILNTVGFPATQTEREIALVIEKVLYGK